MRDEQNADSTADSLGAVKQTAEYYASGLLSYASTRGVVNLFVCEPHRGSWVSDECLQKLDKLRRRALAVPDRPEVPLPEFPPARPLLAGDAAIWAAAVAAWCDSQAITPTVRPPAQPSGAVHQRYTDTERLAKIAEASVMLREQHDAGKINVSAIAKAIGIPRKTLESWAAFKTQLRDVKKKAEERRRRRQGRRGRDDELIYDATGSDERDD